MEIIEELFRQLNAHTHKLEMLQKEQFELVLRIKEIKEELDDEFNVKIKE